MVKMDIVMSGRAGDAGTALLLNRWRHRLEKRLPAFFLEQAGRLPKAEGAAPAGSFSVRIGSEGVFGALWRLGEGFGTGLRVELPRIPLFQETVEICEILEISPYRLLSSGSIWLAENGHWSGGTVIGHTVGGTARVVESSWGIQYLTPPGAEASAGCNGTL